MCAYLESSCGKNFDLVASYLFFHQQDVPDQQPKILLSSNSFPPKLLVTFFQKKKKMTYGLNLPLLSN